jgi:glucosamine--fructose-6-phosphate aminotransferase (isomerizing)
MVGVRKDSPLVVGLGDGEFFLASDVPAFLNYSKDVIFLEDDEMAVLTDRGLSIMGPDSTPLQKEVKSVPWSLSMAEKGGYKHFMLKEIYGNRRYIERKTLS